MTDLICEEHPWKEMGHDGCDGAGVPLHARAFYMDIVVRNYKQQIKEMEAFYGETIWHLKNRIIELEND